VMVGRGRGDGDGDGDAWYGIVWDGACVRA
jgi:hypothetical protein